MSITNIDLITRSLQKLTVISEIETPSAEQGADALMELNQMMAEWEEGGRRLDYFEQSLTSDVCPIPAHAASVVICALAVRLAADYGATVSQELAAQLVAGEERLLRILALRNLSEADMSNRPRAEGNPYGRSRILTG